MSTAVEVGVGAGVAALESLAYIYTPGIETKDWKYSPMALPLTFAALSGVGVGLIAKNAMQTVVGSALMGAAMPMITGRPCSVKNVALSAVTSTAVGLVAQCGKQLWQKTEEGKRSEVKPLDWKQR